MVTATTSPGLRDDGGYIVKSPRARMAVVGVASFVLLVTVLPQIAGSIGLSSLASRLTATAGCSSSGSSNASSSSRLLEFVDDDLRRPSRARSTDRGSPRRQDQVLRRHCLPVRLALDFGLTAGSVRQRGDQRQARQHLFLHPPGTG